MKWLLAGFLVMGFWGCGSDDGQSGGMYVDQNEQSSYPVPDDDPSLSAPELCVDDELSIDQIIVNDVDVEAACGKEALEK